MRNSFMRDTFDQSMAPEPSRGTVVWLAARTTAHPSTRSIMSSTFERGTCLGLPATRSVAFAAALRSAKRRFNTFAHSTPSSRTARSSLSHTARSALVENASSNGPPSSLQIQDSKLTSVDSRIAKTVDWYGCSHGGL